VSRPTLLDRVREAVEALHSAEERQLALPNAAEHLGESVDHLLLQVLVRVVAIYQLSPRPSAAQRLLREAHCADASILLSLIAAHPTTHA
jgi:hypothetical protein